MRPSPALFVLLTQSVRLSPAEAAGQSFSQEPQDLTVTVGQELELPCRVTNIQGKCQWTKDGFGLGTKRSLPGFPRYSMREGGGGDCHLRISPVLPSDEATYQCQVGAGPGFSPIISRPAALRVTSEPGTPYIRQAEDRDVLEVLENQTVILDCFSQGARPPAEIQWYFDGVLQTGNIKETVSREQPGSETFRTHSSLTFRPTKNINVKCSSYSDQFPDTRFSRQLSLTLRFPPKLDLNSPKSVQEGDKFSLTCDSKAYPENVVYKWYLDGVELAGEREETLMIEDISRENHKSAVKCSVENEVGVSEAATTLSVKFPPSLLTNPRSVLAHKGDNVTFHCVAESNPHPVYVWTRHRHNTLEAVTQNFTLTASDRTEKTYVCSVFSEGHEKISSLPARLVLIRRPIVYAERSRKAEIGQDIILTCMVDSLSNITTILWTKNDIHIIDHPKYKVIESINGREYTTELFIKNFQSEDFGNYGCLAANEVGKEFASISIVSSSDIDIMTIAVGITIPILVASGVAFALLIRKHCCSPRGYQTTASKE